MKRFTCILLMCLGLVLGSAALAMDMPSELTASLPFGGHTYTAWVEDYAFEEAAEASIRVAFAPEDTLLLFEEGAAILPVQAALPGPEGPVWATGATLSGQSIIYTFPPATVNPGNVQLTTRDGAASATLKLLTQAEQEEAAFLAFWNALPDDTTAGGTDGKLHLTGDNVSGTLSLGGYLWHGDVIYQYDDPLHPQANVTKTGINGQSLIKATQNGVLLPIYPQPDTPAFTRPVHASFQAEGDTYAISLGARDFDASPAQIVLYISRTEADAPLYDGTLPFSISVEIDGDQHEAKDIILGVHSFACLFDTEKIPSLLWLHPENSEAISIKIPEYVELQAKIDKEAAELEAFWESLPGNSRKKVRVPEDVQEESVPLDRYGYLLYDGAIYQYMPFNAESGLVSDTTIRDMRFNTAIRNHFLQQVYPPVPGRRYDTFTYQGKSLTAYISDYRFDTTGRSYVRLEVNAGSFYFLGLEYEGDWYPVLNVSLQYGNQPEVVWDWAEWKDTYIMFYYDDVDIKPDAVHVYVAFPNSEKDVATYPLPQLK